MYIAIMDYLNQLKYVYIWAILRIRSRLKIGANNVYHENVANQFNTILFLVLEIVIFDWMS
jgi:hypothetical protein